MTTMCRDDGCDVCMAHLSGQRELEPGFWWPEYRSDDVIRKLETCPRRVSPAAIRR